MHNRLFGCFSRNQNKVTKFVPPEPPLPYAEAMRNPPSYAESQADEKKSGAASAAQAQSNVKDKSPEDKDDSPPILLHLTPQPDEQAFRPSFGDIGDRNSIASLIINLLQASVDANNSIMLSVEQMKLSPHDVRVAIVDPHGEKRLLRTDDLTCCPQHLKDEETPIPLPFLAQIRLLDDEKDLIKKGRTIPVTAFTSVSVPSVSIESYFNRFVKFINCSTESFICMLVLLERFINTPRFKHKVIDPHTDKVLDEITRPLPSDHPLPMDWLDKFNVHRFLPIALLVAAKFNDDHIYTNGMWAKVGGLAIKELNALEREFLYGIDHNCFVSEEEFKKVVSQLASRHEDYATWISGTSTILQQNLKPSICDHISEYLFPFRSSYMHKFGLFEAPQDPKQAESASRFFVVPQDPKQVLHIESQPTMQLGRP